MMRLSIAFYTPTGNSLVMKIASDRVSWHRSEIILDRSDELSTRFVIKLVTELQHGTHEPTATTAIDPVSATG